MGRASQALLFGLQRLTAQDDSLTDRELLQRFAAGRDERCFAALVRRHGPMVFGACRRALPSDQDAEDVFQAVFLVLARKAGAGRWRDGVGAWLHEVARRLTAEVRRRDASRKRREDAAARPETSESRPHDGSLAMLDEELARLPEDERSAVILCHLEGRPREQAARQLGLSLRTFERRLARGLDRLRVRLEARGASPSLPTATALPASASLLSQRAAEFVAGSIDPSAAVALANGVLKGAFMARLKIAAALLALAVTGLGTWSLSPREAAPLTAAPAPKWGDWHWFAPIDPDWRVEVTLLKPDGGDPPNSSTVVELKDRDPNFKGYLTWKRYFEKGKDNPRRIVTIYPSGRMASEIDRIGKDQHDRSWYPDGRKAGHVHWRDGKWLDGESISPDGRQHHRLVKGDGQLVTYGRKQGNRVHRWYAKGRNFLDKQFLDGELLQVRLNDRGNGWLILTADDERLSEEKGIWTKTARNAHWQEWGDYHVMGRRKPPPRTYEKARASFVEEYGVILKETDLSWDKLDLDFIPKNKAWPKSSR